MSASAEVLDLSRGSIPRARRSALGTKLTPGPGRTAAVGPLSTGVGSEGSRGPQVRHERGAWSDDVSVGDLGSLLHSSESAAQWEDLGGTQRAMHVVDRVHRAPWVRSSGGKPCDHRRQAGPVCWLPGFIAAGTACAECSARTRGGLREPLGYGWWFRPGQCSDAPDVLVDALPDELVAVDGHGHCDSMLCASCGPRGKARGLRRARAAMAGLIEQVEAQVWLVTLTRRGYVTTPEEAARFNRAARLLGSWLEWAGALGAVGVLEVKLEEALSVSAECCLPSGDGQGPACPLCGGCGRMRAGHLHSHSIVAVRPGMFLSYQWLHVLSSLQVVAGCDVGVDVKRGDQRGGIDGVWGYVGAYLQQVKEPLQQAWLRCALGKHARTSWVSGALRGAVQRKCDGMHADDPEAGRAVDRYVRTWAVREADLREPGSVPLLTRAREAVRSLKARGVEVDPDGLYQAVREDLGRGLGAAPLRPGENPVGRPVWEWRPKVVRSHRVSDRSMSYRRERQELEVERAARVAELVEAHELVARDPVRWMRKHQRHLRGLEGGSTSGIDKDAKQRELEQF